MGPEKIHTLALTEEIENSPSSNIKQIFNLPPPPIPDFNSHHLPLDIHNSIYSWFKFTKILLDESFHTSNYRVYKKRGNPTLKYSNAFIIQSTEIILSQSERTGF